ncbi:MAG: DNA mismatch repair protein MutS [FCB group bacterium]|nr:DNA mismatch repair protein MutS [FCB group bacterium]
MKQYLEVKNQYPDSIVLFRMGDFYETFLEDAKITAKVLGIVLTKRANGAAADIPLAGFPHHALDNYLPKLVNAGHRVAICEQVEDPKLAKGIVKREVIEVVTPGTITSDQALSQKSNHFIVGLHFHRDRVGYAVLDQSTGDFFIGESDQTRLLEALRKFSPREVILGENITYSTSDWYRDLKPFVTTVEDWLFTFDQSYRTLTEHFRTTTLKGFGCENYPLGITAGGVVFYHIRNTLNSSLEHVTRVQPVLDEGIMGLDGFTVKNLEVFKSLATQGTHGTLIDVLDTTITAGGGRLLKHWLYQPLLDIPRLQGRLDVVEGFVKSKRLLNTIREELKQIIDIERVIGKINKYKASPRDVLALGNSLGKIPEICRLLRNSNNQALIRLAERFSDTSDIVDLILKIVRPDAPAQMKPGQIIADGIDEELDELRQLAFGGKQWIAELQNTERTRTGIPSLKIGYNKVFGYYIEVTKTHQEKVPEEYIRKQTLVNSERYITPELKKYEEKILSAESRIEEIEIRIFDELCRTILQSADIIQMNARVFNRLDLLSALALVALNNHYVRPRLVQEPVLVIEGGRHPVVEKLLPPTERFIPNDLKMDTRTSQIHLITGPNMAGKSTYLRQVGLLVLMAQIGSFVPARKATVGIVDKLFTRVGASDNLAGGESTFLVEMNEAANILNNATSRSLILLDEIGRGTATYDGLALAWSITEYLHNTPNVAARTLFATHYHELTELENTLERLENHHAAVREFGDKIVFLRKILPGAGDKSYGIHVARMAGLPNTVLHRATEILNYHLDQNQDSMGTKPLPETSNQLSIFEQQESKLKAALKNLDVENMTPMQALQALDEMKREHGL